MNDEKIPIDFKRMRRDIGLIQVHFGSKIPRYLSWFFPIAAITIGNHIFIKDTRFCSLRLITHEKIHVLQGRELGFLKFWFFYVWEWFKALIKTRDPFLAYRDIPFEREAYMNEDNPEYLVERKPQAWKRYRVI